MRTLLEMEPANCIIGPDKRRATWHAKIVGSESDESLSISIQIFG